MEVTGAGLLLGGVAFAFAFSIGAHYTGACMGMPHAAGAIRLGPALLLMAPLALVGAVVASGSVEETVGHGILAAPSDSVPLAIAILAAALLLTSAYNLLTLPTSTIQILVFATVGGGLADGLVVHWGTIELLLLLWGTAPFVAAALGYLYVRGLGRRTFVSGSGALARPAVLGLVGVGAVASFAMGANDVANASGALVMAGLLGLVLAALVGGLGLAAGVLTWGRPLLRKVSFDIVRMDPAMAIGAQLAQSTVILGAVVFGYFTSMNQALVGAMIGAGAARGRSTVRWKAVRDILVGWGLGPISGGAVGYLFVTLGRMAHWI